MSLAASTFDTRFQRSLDSDQYSDQLFRASEYRNFAIGFDVQASGFTKAARCSIRTTAFVSKRKMYCCRSPPTVDECSAQNCESAASASAATSGGIAMTRA